VNIRRYEKLHIMCNNIKRGKAFTCLYRVVFRIHGGTLFYCSRRMLTVSHHLTWVRCGKIKFIFNRCEDVSDQLLPNINKTHSNRHCAMRFQSVYTAYPAYCLGYNDRIRGVSTGSPELERTGTYYTVTIFKMYPLLNLNQY